MERQYVVFDEPPINLDAEPDEPTGEPGPFQLPFRRGNCNNIDYKPVSPLDRSWKLKTGEELFKREKRDQAVTALDRSWKQQVGKRGFGFGNSGLFSTIKDEEEESVASLNRAWKFQDLLRTDLPIKTREKAELHSFDFWDTQPVPKMKEAVTDNTFIVSADDAESTYAEPTLLPDEFEWCDVDIDDSKVLTELCTFLSENYVMDQSCLFPIEWSKEFLLWVLQRPGWLKNFNFGMREKQTKDLVGFISGVPSTMRVYDKVLKTIDVNFVCIIKKFRSKRLAPKLIREASRRALHNGILQAVFATGLFLPKPIASCRYWHRYLNPGKLAEVEFSHFKGRTLQDTIQLCKLPNEFENKGLVAMNESHLESAHALLEEYLKKFDLCSVFSVSEFAHTFISKDDVIYTYVIADDTGKVTDMISFFSSARRILDHPLYESVKCANAFYNVATTVKLERLMNDALILAYKAGFDIFIALNLMENSDVLEALKFEEGTDDLQFYLFNWKCPEIVPRKIGFVPR